MIKALRPTFALLGLMTLLLGFAYPATVWSIGHLCFPEKAAGTLAYKDGEVIGSFLIGQPFTGPSYFWSRPSETALSPYNFMASGGSQKGAANPEFVKQVEDRLLYVSHNNKASVRLPFDLVTASGSGLDPHISPDAALYQVNRVAQARGLSYESVYELVLDYIRPQSLFFLGETRVNVLRINLALDRLSQQNRAP